MSAVQVAVIDREGFYIDAVRSVLEQQPDINVVACATVYEDFVDAAEEARIIVLQEERPPSKTRWLLRELVDSIPDADVIVFGASDTPQAIVSYLEAGAFGYVRNSESFDQLLQVIRVVHAGETLIHPELAAPLVRRLAELGRLVQEQMPLDIEEIELTSRQHEVMELVVQGLGNQEIADRLSITVGTVKNHVHKIFERMHVGSREQAAALYLRLVEREHEDMT